MEYPEKAGNGLSTGIRVSEADVGITKSAGRGVKGDFIWELIRTRINRPAIIR